MIAGIPPSLVFAVMALSWIAFTLIFLTRNAPRGAPDRKRDPASITGVVLQGLSYAIVWGVHRPYFSPLVQTHMLTELLIDVLAIVLAIGSVIVTLSAVRTLGKEWSVTARVVEGHELATAGPYAFVRHPIYTGMLGMLLATGLATSYWMAIISALAVFFLGTIIRIRSEERLLRETFGSEFDAYSQRVSAIIPGVF
jgi:protein-S-isoprenylcysteine O-methyltransferase Ste14